MSKQSSKQGFRGQGGEWESVVTVTATIRNMRRDAHLTERKKTCQEKVSTKMQFSIYWIKYSLVRMIGMCWQKQVLITRCKRCLMKG